MKKQIITMLAASAVVLGTALPSFADGPMSSMASVAGATTATIIDIPEGMVLEGAWRTPRRAQHTLAEAFGDEKGLWQNVAGVAIGWPWGVVFGVPYGAIRGGQHGWSEGWEKPFSRDSYIVSEEK